MTAPASVISLADRSLFLPEPDKQSKKLRGCVDTSETHSLLLQFLVWFLYPSGTVSGATLLRLPISPPAAGYLLPRAEKLQLVPSKF